MLSILDPGEFFAPQSDPLDTVPCATLLYDNGSGFLGHSICPEGALPWPTRRSGAIRRH
jgi:hypothetical protein